MANVTGTFRYLCPNNLPIGVLDGDQDTGEFEYLTDNDLPLEYLWDFGPAPPANYSVSLASALALADTLDASEPMFLLTDAISLTDTLGVLRQLYLSLPGDSISLLDTLQVMFRRTQTGAITDWRNPPRLVETPWTPRGTCACGLGHVGPQGCNALMGIDVSPLPGLVLSDTLTMDYITEAAVALATGFEGGAGESVGGDNFFRSFTWTGFSPYLDSAPPITTDFVHSGAYSLKLGGVGSGSSLSGFFKTLEPTVVPPFTISEKMYFYITTLAGPASFMALADVTTPSATYSSALTGSLTREGTATVIKLAMLNRIAGGMTVTGSVPLQAGTWYRMYLWMTVEANGSDWSQGFTVYLGDTMTVVDQIGQSGTGYFAENPLIKWGMGDIWDLDRSLEVRVDDCVISLVGLLNRTPFGMALVNPATDISTQWTRGGAVPAASNALNVGDMPGPLFNELERVNSAATPGLVDRFGVDASRVPAGLLHRGYFTIRGRVETDTSYNVRVWDQTGHAFDGPEVSAHDVVSGAPRTDDIMTLGLGGVSQADLAAYHLGYVATGTGTVRNISNLWGTIEYPIL